MDKTTLSKKVKQFHLVSRKLVDTLFAGNYHSVFKGPGLEFNDVREYMPGDDSRFIDWNVSARTPFPYTKTFKEEREMTLQMVVDISPSLHIGSGHSSKKDVAGMVFAILAFAAEANNDRVGSILFSDKVDQIISPQKGKKHILRQISTVLGTRDSGKGSNLALALRSVSELMKRRGIVVILSDFKTSGYWKELSLLSHRHDVIAIRITDPMDEKFPLKGFIELEDPETGDTLAAFGGSRRFKKKYSDFWELQKIAWQNGCKKIGIDILEVSTEDDPALKLMQFFDRRRKR